MHMCQVNCNYKRDNTDTTCPLCKKSEDTIEHVLGCEKANKFTLSKENSKAEWKMITEIYKKNEKNKEVVVIKVQDQNKIIKESKKKNSVRRTKKKEKDKVEKLGNQEIEIKKI